MIGSRTIVTIIILFVCVFLLHVPKAVDAQFSQPNNKFGVHLISPSDDEVRDACRHLANANGGAGGKLTLTLARDGTNFETLQRFHNIARQEGCEFIHPIKNSFADPYWRPLDDETIDYFVNLLRNLRPSSKHLYVVLGNEVNRGDEWGGHCDPVGYARVAKKASEKLRADVSNVKIGLAGLDPYAPDGGFFCSRDRFIRDMLSSEPNLVNDHMDFVTIHEYPDGDMTGSMRSFWRSELDLLRSHGVTKKLPVFITEMAWRRHRGLTEAGAAQRLGGALSSLSGENDVWAITPFVYKYCGFPFDQFSLVSCDGNHPNEVFKAIADIPKVKGEPEHIRRGHTESVLLNELVQDTAYTFKIDIKNDGTDIWKGINGDYDVALFGVALDTEVGESHSFTSFYRVHPGDVLSTDFRFNPGSNTGCRDYTFALTQNSQVILKLFDWKPCVVAHPTAKLQIATFPGNQYTGSGEVQIFNTKENIVFRKKVDIKDGLGDIGPVSGVTFGEAYRIVWLSDGNLPVQIVNASFKKDDNTFTTPMLLPFDPDNDGELTLKDVARGFR